MRKGEEGPAIDLLDTQVTTERNGTEIKIYIKTEKDLEKFLNDTFIQLHYFNNVVIDVEDIEKLYTSSYYHHAIKGMISNLTMNYNLIEGKSFIYRDNTQFKNLHLSIGGVFYPIDFANLGIDTIKFPVALKFGIGELSVIQTREDVRYTDKTVAAILARINDLKEELVELYNKNNTEVESLDEFVNINFTSLNVKLTNTVVLYLDDTLRIDRTLLNPVQIKGFPLIFNSLQDNTNFKSFYNTMFSYDETLYKSILGGVKILKTFTSSGAMKTLTYNDKYKGLSAILEKMSGNHSIRSLMNNLVFMNNYNILFTDTQQYSVKKHKYMFSELKYTYYSTYILSRPKIKLTRKAFIVLYNRFLKAGLTHDIKEFNKILTFMLKPLVDKVKSIGTDYDKLVVPDAWWKKYSSENKSTADYDRTKMAFDKLQNTNGDWNRKDYRYDIKEFSELKNQITVLITKEEQTQYCSNNTDYGNTPVEKLFRVIYNSKIDTSVVLYATSDRNYQKVLKARQEGSRIYTLREFFNSKKMQQRILGKIATYLKLQDFIYEYNINTKGHSFIELGKVFWIMNERFQQDYKDIVTYIENFDGYHRFTMETRHFQALMKEFDELHMKDALYDTDMLDKFNNVINFIELSGINLVQDSFSAVTMFVKNYKPVSSKYFLHSRLLKLKTVEEIATSLGWDSSNTITPDQYIVNSIHSGYLGFNTYDYYTNRYGKIRGIQDTYKDKCFGAVNYLLVKLNTANFKKNSQDLVIVKEEETLNV